MSAQHTPGPNVLVALQVSDALVRRLTGFDPAYFDATGNTRDAQVVRERAQGMWDELVCIAKATGSAQ